MKFRNLTIILIGLLATILFSQSLSANNTVADYRKAAEQGDLEAQYNLAVCYYNGKGVTQDFPEAVKWLRKAAEHGHADAQYNLGFCYYNAYGVAQNKAEAIKWYRLAAAQGNTKAKDALKICLLNEN